MPITITLPDELADRLQSEAEAQKRSAEDLAIALLKQVLSVNEETIGEPAPELIELVARIRSLPPNPNAIRPATGSLEEYLSKSMAAVAAVEEEFDQEAWQRDWDAIEREMKLMSRANDIAEGRS